MYLILCEIIVRLMIRTFYYTENQICSEVEVYNVKSRRKKKLTWEQQLIDFFVDEQQLPILSRSVGNRYTVVYLIYDNV